MYRCRRLCFALLALGVFLHGGNAQPASFDFQPWAEATDPQTKQRYIPVELFTGSPWDGARELRMTPAELSFGDARNKMNIKGPAEWKHTVTGEMYLVYDRANFLPRGTTWQKYAINSEKSGIGRVYDARPNVGTRLMSGGLKFPLGLWKQGEMRKFTYTQYNENSTSKRVEVITIEQIDFTFLNTPHCIEFDWLLTDEREAKKLDHNAYTFCPGKSMARQTPR